MKIAVVGTGISGLACSRMLCRENDIHVFEAGNYIGGHTHTIPVEEESGPRNVDTGFIVFNEKTYPNLIEIFDRLGVASRESNMSFSVFNPESDFEYNATNLAGLLAQPTNLLRPRFWSMIRGILRFYRSAQELKDTLPPETRLGDWLDQQGYSRTFIDDHLIPMAAAVWSTSLAEIRDYPLLSLIRFFDNHGFLKISGRPIWRTVQGGSWSYIEPMTRPFADRIHLNTPVESIRRKAGKPLLKTAAGEETEFDRVILACHGDQALRMLADATESERDVLDNFKYSKNPTTLHHDTRLLPKRKRAWAAWNVKTGAQQKDLLVSYWMNSLQGFQQAPRDYVVTLNDPGQGSDFGIDQNKVIEEMIYEHPLFDQHAVSAQSRHEEIDGVHGVHFCGAYWANGFHEDGVVSGMRVAKKFGRGLEEFSHGR
ncbi:MAG: hypothetical protein CBC13_09190 [Planctomycetia bacterium TMED53]|nr:MAG: hypothetical protein CBC13_09190 [Planctomycetia bacterium TMED53]